MSRQPSSGTYRRPRPDIYTALLAIAMVAVMIGCIVLHLEMRDFGDNPTSGAPVVQNQGCQPLDFDGSFVPPSIVA